MPSPGDATRQDRDGRTVLYQERFGISPDRATPIPTREGEI